MKTREESEFQKLIDHDPEDYYRNELEMAKDAPDGSRQGHISDALELLDGFCTAYEQNRPIPEAIKQYLYDGITKYLHYVHKVKINNEQVSAKKEAEELHKALLLHRKRGRKRNTTTANAVAIVAAYHLMVKRDGLKPAAAKREVEKQYCVGVKRIEQLLTARDWGTHEMGDLDITELEHLARLPKETSSD